MKKLLVFFIIVMLLFWLFQQDWVHQIVENENFALENIQEEEATYELLWLTIPLFILQGVVTSFPFVILLVVHITVFGFLEGILFSWAGTFLGSMVCFYLGRYFFFDYFKSIWQRYSARYGKWIQLTEKYGMWGIIFLRHIPIMPSNIISLIGAFSPMRHKSYLWSSILGNLSMVWLYALISAGMLSFTELPQELPPFLWGYILLALLLCIGFFMSLCKEFNRQQEGDSRS